MEGRREERRGYAREQPDDMPIAVMGRKIPAGTYGAHVGAESEHAGTGAHHHARTRASADTEQA